MSKTRSAAKLAAPEPNSIGGLTKSYSQKSPTPSNKKLDEERSMSEFQSSALPNRSKIVKPSAVGPQSNLLNVALPSLGGKRRVHDDGVLMLDKHYGMREAEKKYNIMENRLKRLQDEERRAQKNQEAAEKKAQQMLKSRARHYQELMDKIQYYEQKNAELEL